MSKLKVFISGSQLNILAAMKKLTKIFQYNKYKINSGLTNVFYDCACLHYAQTVSLNFKIILMRNYSVLTNPVSADVTTNHEAG